jgi:hypothetical protein
MGVLLAVVLAGGGIEPSRAQPEPVPAPRPRDPAAPPAVPALHAPTTDEISQALAKVEADPNLAAARTIRTLRWRGASEEPRSPSAWLAWLARLFAWFAETGRFVVWVAVLLLAGVLGVYVVRLVRRRGAAVRTAERFVAPSHVRDLDIRPESLPEDIGAAARELWDRGEQRAALALLYRGLLSRLAHAHGVPIRDSSTEGECLALAALRLGSKPMSFAARLVGVWQVAVYGGESPKAEQVYSLCEAFGPTLDAAPAPAPAPAPALAPAPAPPPELVP